MAASAVAQPTIRKDGTYPPGAKTRCKACGLAIRLLPVEGSPFPRFEWESAGTGDHCSPKGNRGNRSGVRHRPTRPGVVT